MGRTPQEPKPDGAAESAADAELTGRGDSGWGDVSEDASEEFMPFDPTGLDLARSVADAVSHTAPLPTPKPRKKREPGRGASGMRGKRDPLVLGEALEGVISQRGWSTEVNVHLLLGRWPALVGPTNAEHTTPESFVAGVVTVRADSTAWASQLRLMAPQLLAKLNAALGDGTIKRITVKGPDAPSWKHGIRAVRDGRGPRDTYG
jgi:predicted nucleic acid-binding Zn ribbon protein